VSECTFAMTSFSESVATRFCSRILGEPSRAIRADEARGIIVRSRLKLAGNREAQAIAAGGAIDVAGPSAFRSPAPTKRTHQPAHL